MAGQFISLPSPGPSFVSFSVWLVEMRARSLSLHTWSGGCIYMVAGCGVFQGCWRWLPICAGVRAVLSAERRKWCRDCGVRECASHLFVRDTCERWPRAFLTLTPKQQRLNVNGTVGENMGPAKAENWCLWCRYWRNKKKGNILLVVLAVKAWAVQSCFMCVSHTCIVLQKFVYYTWRFKR